MAIRLNQHPGVEIRERDRSQTAPAIVGTTVSIMGFANKGVPYEPVDIVSISDFESNFGDPTNEAETYFYNGCREVLANNGALVATKLPYNNTQDLNYRYIPITFEKDATNCNRLQALVNDPNYIDQQSTLSGAYDAGITHALSAEVGPLQTISNDDYDYIVVQNDIAGSSVPNVPDFIIVNENKGVLENEKETGGLFVVLFDMLDALVIQRIFSNDDTDPANILQGIKVPAGTESYNPVTSGNIYDNLEVFTTNLTGTIAGNSVSESVMRLFPTIEFKNGGEDIDLFTTQHIGVAVCKTVADENLEGRLSITVLESYIGSVHADARDDATGQSIYLPNIVNANSSYIKMYGNSDTTIPKVENYALDFRPDTGIMINFTQDEGAKIIDGAAMVNHMEVVFEKLSDINDRQIDVVSDNGLSTIAQFTDDVVGGTLYVPEFDVDPNDTIVTSTSQLAVWRSVCDSFINFCQNVRKDCMTILDIPRNIELEGNNKRVRKTKPDNTFSNTISPQLKFITGLNSSYAALYSNWRLMNNEFTGRLNWVPPTISVGGIYVNNDAVGEIFDAPAGLNRGIIRNIAALAFQPNGRNQDDIYKKSINYAVKYPVDGFILEGQKTTQVRNSAFSRVNVRRLFLRLERLVYNASRQFVYEPNNVFTRRRLIDTINPTFATYKANGGLYDYMIVCDELNNTPEVIDNNELRVAILLKPVRTAEFILVDFIATRTDANFEELI